MRKVKVVGIALFMVALILPSLLWVSIRGLDLCGLILMENIESDTGEKRENTEFLEEMTYVSIGSSIEEYYNDRIPFRSSIINLNKRLTGLVERPYNEYLEKKYAVSADKETTEEQLAEVTESVQEENYPEDIVEDTYVPEDNTNTNDTGEENQESNAKSEEQQGNGFAGNVVANIEIVEGEIEGLIESEVEETIEESETTSDLPLRIVNDKVVLGADGWLFYGESKSIENFRGTNLKSEEELANYAQPFIAIKTYCEMNDKQFRAFVCPDKENIYTEYYPAVERVSDISLTEQVQSYITNNSSVQFIYPKNELKKYKKNYQLYYKHDSHWNSAGGFVGTRELLLSLGIPTQTIDSIYTAPVTISSGDLILLGGLSLDEYPEDTNYDVGFMNHVGVFCDDAFNSDKRMIDITSQSENHSHLVMVGDSCKMNMLQYLAVNYDHVTFIHKNAVSDSSSQKVINEADVIVLEIAERNVNEFSTLAWKVYEAVEKKSQEE